MTEERIAELQRVARSVFSCISEHEAYPMGSVVGELIAEVRRLRAELEKANTKER